VLERRDFLLFAGKSELECFYSSLGDFRPLGGCVGLAPRLENMEFKKADQ
jgi:hypothetical protein